MKTNICKLISGVSLMILSLISYKIDFPFYGWMLFGSLILLFSIGE